MDEVYDLKTAGRYIGLGTDALLLKIKAGQITALQPGGAHGKWFIPASEISRIRREATAAREAK